MLSTKVIKTSILGPRIPLGTVLNDEPQHLCTSETKNAPQRHFTTHILPRTTTSFPAACMGGSRTGHKVQTNVIFTGSDAREEKPHRKRNGLNGSFSLRNLFGQNSMSRVSLRPLKASWSGCKKLLYNTLGVEKERVEEEEASHDTGQSGKQSTFRQLQNEARKWDKRKGSKHFAIRLEQITEKKKKKDEVQDLGLYIPKYSKPETPVIHSIKQFKTAGMRQMKRVQTPKGQPTPIHNILHKLAQKSTEVSPRKEMRNYIEKKTQRTVKELKKDQKESALSKYMRKGKFDEEIDGKENIVQEKSSTPPTISFPPPPKSFLNKSNSGLYAASPHFLKVSPPNETQVNYTSSHIKNDKPKKKSVSSKKERKKPPKVAEKEVSTENDSEDQILAFTPYEPILSASTKRVISMNSLNTEKMILRQDQPLRDVKLFKDSSLEWWNNLVIYKRPTQSFSPCKFISL